MTFNLSFGSTDKYSPFAQLGNYFLSGSPQSLKAQEVALTAIAAPRCARGPAFSIGCARTSPACRRVWAPKIASGSASISIPSARWSAAFRKLRPARPISHCRTSIARSAYRPRTPIMRG